MAGFLYFLPGPPSPTPDQAALANRGLAYAFPRPPVPRPAGGPEGQAGLILASADAFRDQLRVGYFPDRQTWRKIPGGDVYLGFYTAEPPGPSDLARPDATPGHTVTLGDGAGWTIPLARGIDDENGAMVYYQTLPRTTALDEAGRWVAGGYPPKFARLWDLACAWWDTKVSADLAETAEGARASFDFNGAHDAALLALATNYRVDRAEVAALGLFNPPTVRDILDALIDWPVVLKWMQKKTAPLTPGPSSVRDGPPASPPTIGPPPPTSGPSPSASSPPPASGDA